MGSEQSLFNKEQFKKNHKGVEDLIPSTIDEFLHHVPDMMLSLQNAYNDGTQDKLTMAAHSLKGAIASVCSDPVRDIAYKIETLSRENKREQIPPHMAELESGLKQLKNDLKSFQMEMAENG